MPGLDKVEAYKKLAHSVIMNPNGEPRTATEVLKRAATLRQYADNQERMMDTLQFMQAFAEMSVEHAADKGALHHIGNAAVAFQIVARGADTSTDEKKQAFEERLGTCMNMFRGNLDKVHPATVAAYQITNMERMIKQDKGMAV